MKIMYVTSECAPFVKTGGLGDVAGSLPKALAAKGHDVRVFCPLYSTIGQEWREKFYYLKTPMSVWAGATSTAACSAMKRMA